MGPVNAPKRLLYFLKAGSGARIRRVLAPVGRWLSREERRELNALAAYSGLVHQAFHVEPFKPWVCPAVMVESKWEQASILRPTESPARREFDNAVHHYGHDIILKRAANLPLVGKPLPFMLEHGVNYSEESSFEEPQHWVRAYICMGPSRAARLRYRFGVNGIAVGPYINYAKPVLEPGKLAALKQSLGKVLLVVPVHSVNQVKRDWSTTEMIKLVTDHCKSANIDTVIWQCYWKDPPPADLPLEWVLACNGHTSNPWFLDCQRTLLELSDEMVTPTLGSHLGYALALNKSILMARLEIQQDLSATSSIWQHRYSHEWIMREQLMTELGIKPHDDQLQPLDGAAAKRYLNPYFGFDRHKQTDCLAKCLHGNYIE
ncbi:hypothetical protein VB734_00120 [Synechococcus sp. BA-124 BA4]|uniref:hypothetical protein n=1 Tax=unclassified Synechococcus TaxID=2626047 RepID=UPI0018CE9CA1|nr:MULTISPECIES: hypothetical protein [unclassified Synechococcus]MEA5398446.1 hypothetical protein [Synechococcus sp. BA-124 BA4]QPN57716.1 hypothetical protein I1E95_06495 [Synechococcus sp. CBW1107]